MLDVQMTLHPDGTVTYSHTPLEVVAHMQAYGERMCVARGSCPECPFVSDAVISYQECTAMEDECVKYQRFMPCLKDAVVQYYRTTGIKHVEARVPERIGCKWFYQRHIHENAYLHALDSAGLIVYYDVTDLDGVRDLPGSVKIDFDMI